MKNNLRYWAVIPAAGAGKRMGSETPKQYMTLHGKTILEHTLERMATHPDIHGVIVSVSAGDAYWQDIQKPEGVQAVEGGRERCHSVLNALEFLSNEAASEDWVLVHDAARPCIRHSDLDLLIEQAGDHPVGGLLGLPVADTVKRVDPQQQVLETVPREELWRALTPQMFRHGELQAALQQALADDYLVTDDASAMEHVGKQPLMVHGHGDNIKITHPQDLALAGMYLQQQEQGACV